MSDTYPGRRQRPAKTGRFTPRRAAERRKLVRLADELGDAAVKYADRLTIWERAAITRTREALERLAGEVDRDREILRDYERARALEASLERLAEGMDIPEVPE